MSLVRATFVIGLLVAAGACASPETAVIDTWRVGATLDCGDARCRTALDAGLRGLTVRDRGQAPVESASLHAQATCRDPATGQEILSTRSGGPIWVLVATLADGSTHAIGVGYPGISQDPVVFDWDSGPGCP
jgi:hypothetical protein